MSSTWRNRFRSCKTRITEVTKRSVQKTRESRLDEAYQYVVTCHSHNRSWNWNFHWNAWSMSEQMSVNWTVTNCKTRVRLHAHARIFHTATPSRPTLANGTAECSPKCKALGARSCSHNTIQCWVKSAWRDVIFRLTRKLSHAVVLRHREQLCVCINTLERRNYVR
jgi:hypothetical protein